MVEKEWYIIYKEFLPNNKRKQINQIENRQMIQTDNSEHTFENRRTYSK